ncbi:uroporphyrinogen-III C-methyltransferase [Chitinimonas sp.]|uniref:uroporphyrinogen-III C-methyltransferase n=1 Tax=Chitinimonas sp. TaxID=1934313 RepID=UPI002F92B2B0
MTKPLASRRFLLTRPAKQAEHLAELLTEQGAVPLRAPMIAIAPSGAPELLTAVLARLEDFDLAVFVSPTALDEVAAKVVSWPAELTVAVVGPASQARAQELGMRDVISPEARFDSEGLLEHPLLQQMAGRRVVLFRGNGGRELLADTLLARGATVEVVEAYRRLPPELGREQVAALLADGCDGVIVTSSEAAQNLFALCDEVLAGQLRQTRFFASHPAIAETVRQFGVSEVVGTRTGDAGIVASLREYFSAPAPAPTAVPAASADAGKPAPLHAPVAGARPQGQWRWIVTAVVLAVLVSLAIVHYQRQMLRAELGSRFNELERRQQMLSAGEQRDGGRMSQLDAQLESINHHIEELRAQQVDLQSLYGAIAGDQEETLLADAELTLSLASQQLQLTGNVGASLAALYRLDERLAGHDKPRLMPLRRALAKDIDSLKRVPWVDYVGLSNKLDTLAGSVDRLPLVVDAKTPEDQAASEAAPRTGFWGELGRALGALVEIRRIDQPDPVLLAPEQSLYLREHVKLRLLNARLALLQRDEPTFRHDLVAADAELRKHFDIRAKPVIATLTTLRELQSAQPAQVLPSLADSLNAARDARRKASREDSK